MIQHLSNQYNNLSPLDRPTFRNTHFTSLFNIPTEESPQNHSIRCKLVKRMLLDGADPNIPDITSTPLLKCCTYNYSDHHSQLYYTRQIDLLCLLLKYAKDTLQFEHVKPEGHRHFIDNILQIITYELQDSNVWNTRVYPLLKYHKHKMNIDNTYSKLEITYLPHFNGKDYDEKYEADFKLFRELLYLGGSVNAQDIDWEYVIMFAVANDDFKLVNYLLRHGADVKDSSPYASSYDVALGLCWRKKKCNPKMFRHLMNIDNHLSNIKYLENGYPVEEIGEEAMRCILREVKRGSILDGISEVWRKHLTS